MAILLQRLCWNSRGWREPTGDDYNKETSYVGENGFGHEEWNLNTADLINGKVYGYTYYNPPRGGETPLGPHSIYFFTIAPTKERLLVGAYLDAYFLDPSEQQRLRKHLEGSELLDRRADKLVALGLPHLQSPEAALKHLVHDFALNVCTEPDQVVAFSPPRVLQSADTGGRNPLRLNRYTKPVFLDRAPPSATNQQPPAIHSPPSPPGDLLEDSYVRFTRPQRRVIVRCHNLLSNRFKKWLATTAQATEISVESNSVDVTCVSNKQLCLFELKTCYKQSTRHALREALGQLLEYAFYPGRPEYQCRAVVLDTTPAVSDVDWFRRLSDVGFSVELFWLVGEKVYSAKLTKHPLVQHASTFVASI